MKEVFKKFEMIDSTDKEEANKLISKLLKYGNADEHKSAIVEIDNYFKYSINSDGSVNL